MKEEKNMFQIVCEFEVKKIQQNTEKKQPDLFCHVINLHNLIIHIYFYYV